MTTSKLAAVLALNVLFFTTVHSSWNTPPPPWNTPPPPVSPPPPCPPPPVSPPPPPTPPVSPPLPPPTPPVSPPLPPPTPPVSPPHPPTPPPPGGSCPINALQLAVCATTLQLLKLGLPPPAGGQCCPLLSGLADLDVAVCLCTALQANILGSSVNLPLDLILLVNYCGKTCPPDFTCPKH